MTDEKKGIVLSLVMSQAIITIFMVWDIYIFITKESVVAKTFAAIAFVIFISMTFLFIKSIYKLKDKKE